jgi:hypothetical protein
VLRVMANKEKTLSKTKSPGEFVTRRGCDCISNACVSGCPSGEWRAYQKYATYYDDVNNRDNQQAQANKSPVENDHAKQAFLLKTIRHN